MVDIIPTLEPARSKTDWAKKLMITFIFLIFVFIAQILLLSIFQSDAYLTADSLTLVIINLAPLIFALFGVYAIFKADFVEES